MHALYIFHQTITVALIYMFAARDLIPNKPLEVSLSVVGTLLGSWALAELVYRIKPLRPFFGLSHRVKSVRPCSGSTLEAASLHEKE